MCSSCNLNGKIPATYWYFYKEIVLLSYFWGRKSCISPRTKTLLPFLTSSLWIPKRNHNLTRGKQLCDIFHPVWPCSFSLGFSVWFYRALASAEETPSGGYQPWSMQAGNVLIRIWTDRIERNSRPPQSRSNASTFLLWFNLTVCLLQESFLLIFV